jgi:hypothetical protein
MPQSLNFVIFATSFVAFDLGGCLCVFVKFKFSNPKKNLILLMFDCSKDFCSMDGVLHAFFHM